jgi:hypothetical protein
MALEASISLLRALEALSSDEEVTPLGKVLADLPIDAVLGKMLIMSTVSLFLEFGLLLISNNFKWLIWLKIVLGVSSCGSHHYYCRRHERTISFHTTTTQR